MVNVSTLFYVLENLEGKDEELIDPEEIQQLEKEYLNRLLVQVEFEPDPALINKIIQNASTH